ncbi:MAG: hypothetical protein JKX81_08280 [Arenicella sp.]|nr:hypothetical protein [Arenicella sp.]
MKYEEVYLNCYESMAHAKQWLGPWVGFYNRKYQTLKSTPNQSKISLRNKKGPHKISENNA